MLFWRDSRSQVIYQKIIFNKRCTLIKSTHIFSTLIKLLMHIDNLYYYKITPFHGF